MKTFLDENDHAVDMVLFDGYAVGERLLEGVMFQCRILNGRVSVTLPKGTAGHDYMTGRRLSIPQWIREIEEFVQDYDVFTHPDTGADVYLEDVVTAVSDIPPVTAKTVVGKSSGFDLLRVVKSLKP
jgi:hypothetical protein